MNSSKESEMRAERFTKFSRGMRLPLIAAPMFLVSGPELVVAAARAGVAAAFPAPNARTLETLQQWLEEITQYQATHQGGGPWALNLVTHSSYDRLSAELELVDRYQPPLVITALGSPASAVSRVHAYGGMVFADVSNLAFARKAVAMGVDGLVLVCAGAGGHTGTLSPFSFVAAVREFFDGIIVLAGSIGNGGAVRAAQAMGADLAYAGTPFIVANESLAAVEYKDMVVRASLEDLVLTKTFTGADAWYLCESIIAAGLDPNSLVGKDKMDWTNSQGQLKAWRNIWSAGQGVNAIHSRESVASIVERLVAEYRAAAEQPVFADVVSGKRK